MTGRTAPSSATGRVGHFGQALLAAAPLALMLLAGFAGPAMAGCSSPPAPDVDWQRCRFSDRALTGIDVRQGNLREASFFAADLSGSNFSGIDGRRAKFVDTRLVGARFDGAQLRGADFTRADLSRASFQNADLRRTQFFRATLVGADFTGAKLDGADFLNADLSGALWSDGKTHCAAGSIGQCRPSPG